MNFAMRRPSGYISEYRISRIYGSYRANIYFKNNPPSTPMVQFRKHGKWREIPAWIMPVLAPFNRYKRTLRGEYFMRGVRQDK